MNPSPKPVQNLPTQYTLTQKLTCLFESVLHDFVGLSVEESSSRSRNTNQMPLERRVRLFGSTSVLVVMRSHPVFAEALAERFQSDQADPTPSEEAFMELLDRYCGAFIGEFLPTDNFLPFKPELSQPGIWPARPSDVCFAVEVMGQPVEVRFWIGTREGLYEI